MKRWILEWLGKRLGWGRWGGCGFARLDPGVLTTIVLMGLCGQNVLAQDLIPESALANSKVPSIDYAKLRTAEKINVYRVVGGSKGAYVRPYVSPMSYGHPPHSQKDVREYSCTYQSNAPEAINALVDVLIGGGITLINDPESNSPRALWFMESSGSIEYSINPIENGGLIADFIFSDGTQSRFNLEDTSGIGGGYITSPISENQVLSYSFTNRKDQWGYFDGTWLLYQFFSWLRLYGGRPTVEDYERVQVEDCDVLLRLTIYNVHGR